MSKIIKQPTTLGQHQRFFMRLVPLLINHAYEQGYELTLGDGFRDPRAFGKMGESKMCGPDHKIYGRNNSNHKRRLAIDLNLFKDGIFLTQTSDHEFLGEYWETLNPLCAWGGRFNDGNHYSFNYKGFR